MALAKISLFCYIDNMAWTVLALNHLVEDEIDKLPVDMRAG